MVNRYSAGELRDILVGKYPIFDYRPHELQEAAHRSKAPSVAVTGGNQSGKTTFLVTEVPAWCCGFRPFFDPNDDDFIVNSMTGPIELPNVVRILCTDFKTGLMQAVWPKFKAMWPESWYDVDTDSSGYPTCIRWKWGSELWFLSQEQDVKKFESATFHGMGYDEPPDRDRLMASRRGLMKTAGREAFSLTPIGQIYLDDVFEKSRFVEQFKFETEHNLTQEGGGENKAHQVLNRDAYERFTELMTPLEKAIRTKGDTSARRGRVIKSFINRAPYVIEPFQIPLHWHRIAIVDTHERKPDAVIWWACDPDLQESVIYDEVMDETTQGTVARTAATMRSHEIITGAYPNRSLIDPRAAQKMQRETGLTVKELFARAGRKVEPAPGIAVESGFKAIREWLMINPATERPRLQIFNTCVGVIDELMLLRWKLAPGGMAFHNRAETEGKDDFVSCMRYLFVWDPKMHDTKPASQRFEDSTEAPFNPLSEMQRMIADPCDGTWAGEI